MINLKRFVETINNNLVGAELIIQADNTQVLSDRERHIIELLSRGMTCADIAGLLCRSPETIKSNVKEARQKVGAKNIAHLVFLAERNSWIV